MQVTGQQDGDVQYDLVATSPIQTVTTRAALALRRALGQTGNETAGWWLVGLLEGSVGIAIVVAAGAMIPGQWGLLGVQPHPFWIVVLAIALRYGRGAGYAIGVGSALTYGILEFLRPAARFAPLSTHDLIQPFLFLVGGVLVGELAQAHYRRLAVVEGRCNRASAHAAEVDGRYQALLAAHVELQRRIVGQPASVATVHAAVKMLAAPHSADVYPAILDLVARLVGADAVALYLEGDGRYDLQAARPADLVGRPRMVAVARHEDAMGGSVTDRAVCSRTIVTIRDLILQGGPSAAADEPALMAGPVLTEDGRVRAIVVVERLPFLRLTPDTVELFRIILDWAAIALDHAERYERACTGATRDQERVAYPAAHTLEILEREKARATTGGLGPLAPPVLPTAS